MNDEGRLMNSSLLDYRMPTSLDVTMMETGLVEVPNPGHPFGVRGAGEACIVPLLAAIANAVYNEGVCACATCRCPQSLCLRRFKQKTRIVA